MSSAAQESDGTGTDDAAARLSDFSDWLSPMLVKELRQGLRTKVFVVAFILLQAVLSMVLLFSLGGNSGASSYSFWLVSAVLVVGVMPLRGFAALSEEIEDHTFDLLMVTRLSSLRIAFGKWSALIVQTLLLCVTILPYVFMRYFLGGIDLRMELSVFYYLFLLSSVLTALTVAFSVFPSFLIRSVIAMVAGYVAAQLTAQLITFHAIPAEWLSTRSLAMAGCVGLYACWFLLELGASRIASAAENHAVRKRIASLIVVSIIGILSVPAWRGLLLALALIPAIDALSESNNDNRSIVRPFVRIGFLGRIAGRLLYPGWSSGVGFTLVMAAIAVGADIVLQRRLFGNTIPNDVIVQWIAWPAAVLLPVPVLAFFERRKPMENRFGVYMVSQAAVSSLGFAILLIANATRQFPVAVSAFMLPNGLLAASYGDQYTLDLLDRSSDLIYIIAGATAGWILVSSLASSWFGLRRVRAAEREIVKG